MTFLSIAAEVIRPFWVPGLNNVSKPQLSDFSSWLNSQKYQIYDPITTNKFTLYFTTPEQILAAIASDCDRLAIASFESIANVYKNPVLPKSTGWQVIQTYYSAFFAAHTILRILGVSCTQVDASSAKLVFRIANGFGQSNGVASIEQGLYVCRCDISQGCVMCEKDNGRGVHEAFWNIFNHSVKKLSNEILQAANFPGWDQSVSIKLDELSFALCTGSFSNGAWLSSIRNKVNYKQQLSTWFPYHEHNSYHSNLFDAKEEWKRDPMTITLTHPETNDLQRFHATCHFVVGLCRVMVSDIAQRSSKGKSFVENGAMTLLRFIG